MVETRKRSRRPARKGGLRGGFCDTNFREMVRNGEISPSAEMTPVSKMRRNTAAYRNGSAEYRRYSYAFTETLLHYFDEEWFDFDYQVRVIMDKAVKNKAQDKTSYSNQPYRCTECEKPWSRSDTKQPEYYDIELFKNIPMEKRLCLKCKDAQPATVE